MGTTHHTVLMIKECGIMHKLGILLCGIFLSLAVNRSSETTAMSVDTTITNLDQPRREIRVAFLGNSMFYFNDCPRLLEQMMQDTGMVVTQNSCLRGGATLVSLWMEGNGMGKKFSTPPALQEDGTYDIGAATVEDLLRSNLWTTVVINDHTQSPAREVSKEKAKKVLTEKYRPLLHNTTQVVFLHTPAYRFPRIRDSDDLGDFDEFTDRVAQGYQEYKQLFPNSMIAPVGEAYRLIKRQDERLWEALYSWDDFHPSPTGTWLEACVIYCTILRMPPPIYNPLWWEKCRYMQPPDQDPLPRPTVDDAETVRRIACYICGIESDFS